MPNKLIETSSAAAAVAPREWEKSPMHAQIKVFYTKISVGCGFCLAVAAAASVVIT